MAEQVRLKRGGLALRVPQVDFAASKVEAQGFANLARSLDSMTNYFLREAEQKAQIEGAEYGALNAPTRQQLRDAAEQNTSVIIPGDKSSVYGRAVRKAAIEALDDQVSLLAKRQITDAVLAGKAENKAPLDVEDDIATIIAGYAATFDKTAPIAARRFRANMGIYGNAEYESYAKQFLIDDQDRRKAEFQVSYELTKENVFKMFDGGKIKSPIDGSDISAPAPTTEVLAQIKTKVLTDAISYDYSKSDIETLANDFDSIVTAAAENVIVNMVVDSKDKYNTYLRIQNNNRNLPDNIKAALDALSGEQRAKAISEARTAWLASIGDEDELRKLAEARRQDDIKDVEQNFSLALLLARREPAKAINQMQKAITDMTPLDASKANEMNMLLPTNGSGFAFAPVTNEAVRTTIDTQLNNMDITLTLSKLDMLLLRQKLSYGDWLTYTDKVRARQDSRFNDAVLEIRKKLKVPSGVVADKSLLNNWRFNTLNEVELAMRKALRNAPEGGRNFDPFEWLDDNFEELTQGKQENWTQGALSRLEVYTRQGVEQKLNAAVSSGNQEDITFFQDLLDLADQLEQEGTPAPGF